MAKKKAIGRIGAAATITAIALFILAVIIFFASLIVGSISRPVNLPSAPSGTVQHSFYGMKLYLDKGWKIDERRDATYASNTAQCTTGVCASFAVYDLDVIESGNDKWQTAISHLMKCEATGKSTPESTITLLGTRDVGRKPATYPTTYYEASLCGKGSAEKIRIWKFSPLDIMVVTITGRGRDAGIDGILDQAVFT